MYILLIIFIYVYVTLTNKDYLYDYEKRKNNEHDLKNSAIKTNMHLRSEISKQTLQDFKKKGDKCFFCGSIL